MSYGVFLKNKLSIVMHNGKEMLATLCNKKGGYHILER